MTPLLGEPGPVQPRPSTSLEAAARGTEVYPPGRLAPRPASPPAWPEMPSQQPEWLNRPQRSR